MPRFVWDPEKGRRNLAKHGVAFEDAVLVFADPLHIVLEDRVQDGEERWHAIGRARGVILLLVVHTYPDAGREEVIRIISARKATPNERKRYEAGP